MRGDPVGAVAQANVTEEHTALDAWCAAGLQPIEGGGCFAAPRDPRSPMSMVVYLHGRYGPDTVDEEMARQTRVMRLATAKGYAVLAMHGVQGECTAAELESYWCWPSNEHNASDAPPFVARIDAAIARARERIGAGPNVLLGFSNGGYFAELIAKRALARFDAIAIAHAGPIDVTPAKLETPPILLVTADDDVLRYRHAAARRRAHTHRLATRARRTRGRARAARLGHRYVAHVLRARAKGEAAVLAAAPDALAASTCGPVSRRRRRRSRC